ncbi:MAG: hypothetical protein ACREPA_04380 [Candidatus Dormibacteraceae bacterium]
MGEEQIAWTAMPYRAPVLDATGEEIGSTESLLGDEAEDIFHGIVVKLADGGRLVEVVAAQVSMITRQHVRLSVASDQVAGLPAYREEHWYHLGWGGLFRKRPEWKQD